MKFIESRNNPLVKKLTSLDSRKGREAESLFFFEGVHLLEEYLRFGNVPEMLIVREDVTDRYQALISRAGVEPIVVTESVYNKITDEKSPQGIFTVSRFLNNIKVGNIEEKPNGNSVMLVDLQDMGNVGTVIRTAAALDCSVLLCGECADIYSPKAVRATMGALFSADIVISRDCRSAVESLKSFGVRVIASALYSDSLKLGELDIKPDDCFAVGNEGKGLSDEIINLCDMSVYIPMSGKTESLNAASAASMLLWEAKRTVK